MKVSGPHLDRPKKRSGQPKHWYLRYAVPRKNSDGTIVLVEGRPVLERKRPYYESRDEAEADKPAILAQYAAAGVNARGGILTRDQAAEFEQARAIVPEASPVDIARFWRMHHPLRTVLRVKEIAPLFLTASTSRLGKTAHTEDLKSRVGIFGRTFGERIPETITRGEIMRWLEAKPGHAKSGRTVLNLKQAVCRFFNWMREQDPPYLTHNPAGGIKREQLPKIAVKEIRFLSLEESEFYLRACERYDPDMVAHEIVQLLAGVRADDEMSNFRGEWVLPQTQEVVIVSGGVK